MAQSLSFRRRANASLTIYNKYVDPTTKLAVWQRTAIVNANGSDSVIWSEQKAVNTNKSGLIESNRVGITIPYSAFNATYLLPLAWLALTNKAGYWTLKADDMVVRGLVTDEIAGSFTVTSLKAKYDNVLAIKVVDLVDQGPLAFQHWQVGAN